MTVLHLPLAGGRRMPWANGGGFTREILRSPIDTSTYDWRLSQADIDSDGPFSIFHGLMRELVLLSGALRLTFDETGHDVELTKPCDRIRFAGGSPVNAQLIDGRVRDLNIIWDPLRFSVEVHSFDLNEEVKTISCHETLLVYIAAGTFDCRDVHLREGDTLRIDGAARDVIIAGTGRTIVVEIIRK
jgi:uncharacterized protein